MNPTSLITDFLHVLVQQNERNFVLCFYKFETDDEINIVATDGEFVYKTKCKQDLSQVNPSKVSFDLKNNQCFVKCTENEEYTLLSLEGSQKKQELFNLIIALAEFKSKNAKTSGDTPKKLYPIPALVTLPAFNKRCEQIKRHKGNSIINPMQKKRKPAEGVKFEDDE